MPERRYRRADSLWRIGHHFRLSAFRQCPGIVALTAARQPNIWWRAGAFTPTYPTAEQWRQAFESFIGAAAATPGGDRTVVSRWARCPFCKGWHRVAGDLFGVPILACPDVPSGKMYLR